MTERDPGLPIVRKSVVRRKKVDVEAKAKEREAQERRPRPEARTRREDVPEKKRSAAKVPPERADAEKLAEDKGIAYIHALRIIREEITLADVLRDMVRKEHLEQLVSEEGIAKALAGQVASGQLERDRALLLTRMAELRGSPFDWDGFRVAHQKATDVAILSFGEDWKTDRFSLVSTYDVTLAAAEGDGAVAPEPTPKHLFKALAPPHTIPMLEAERKWDEEIQAAGLGSTEDRTHRVKPDDETLFGILESGHPVTIITRDGEIFRGAVRSFGRWDVDLVITRGVMMTIFFHAMHPKTSWKAE